MTDVEKPIWPVEDLPPRLKARVKMEDGCWLCGPKDRYAQHRDKGHQVLAHRFIYELFIGPIPQGRQIDHLCRNRSCINPSHLEVVTAKENIRRGLSGYFGEKYKGKGARPWRRKTHCKRGHLFEGYNVIIDWKGKRMCRICYNASRRQIRAKKRGYNS